MASPTIRPATTADADGVADTLWWARAEAYPAVPAFVHPRDSVDRWVREVLLPTHEVTVVETAERPPSVIGVLTTRRVSPTCS